MTKLINQKKIFLFISLLFICLNVFTNCASVFQGIATGMFEGIIQYLKVAFEPIFGISAISIKYYQVKQKWPEDEKDLKEIVDSDSLEVFLSKFENLSFNEKQNKNLEINFICKDVKNDSIHIRDLRGKIEIDTSSYFIQDTFHINASIKLYGGSATYCSKKGEDSKSCFMKNSEFSITASNIKQVK